MPVPARKPVRLASPVPVPKPPPSGLPERAPSAAQTLEIIADIAASIGAGDPAYQQALDEMLADIANPDKSFAFVEAAIAAGDTRGAIAALERLVLLNPQLANLKLELGVLYQNTGSPDLARSYIEQALATETVPPEIRARAETLLAEAKDDTQRQRISGVFSLAGRFETNATAAPSSADVLVRDEIRTLDSDDTADEDGSLVGSLRLNHQYDFASQRGNRLETNGLVFFTRYIENADLNADFVSLDVGPRFFLGGAEARRVSLRPFLALSYLGLESDDYRYSAGGGLNATTRFSPRLSGTATVRADYDEYSNTPSRSTAEDRTGPRYGASGSLRYAVSPRTAAQFTLFVDRRDADESFEAFTEVGTLVTLQQSYDAPFALTSAPWQTTFGAGYRYRTYDDPDPAVSTVIEQEENRFDVYVDNAVPLTERVRLRNRIGYTNNDANIRNDDYDNLLISLGVDVAF